LQENPDISNRIEALIRGKTEEVGDALMTGPEADDDV
jgi:recombination protein RecA